MRVAAMPSDETPLPGLLPKQGEPTPARSLKAESPLSKGHAGQSAKKAGGGAAAWKSRHPASEGEKDSGFSDVSSEYLSTVEQTDTEEQPACPLRRPARLQRVPPKASVGLPGSAFTGIAPLYIVKNVLLKQPLGASPTTQLLAWSSQHPLDGSQGSPARLLFIQQPVAALKPLLPGRKAPAKDTSLPVLGAYPKIAPHPGRDPKAPLPGCASQNKRFCLEETWVSSSEPAAPTGGREPPPLVLCPPAGLEAVAQDTVTSSTSPALPPGLDPAEGRMISRASRKLGCSSVGKQRRFHNTVEILRKSGLLGITLRTKELIRQNSSTQRELAELREHAQLLCEAVQSNEPQAWARLQEAMSRSAAYWASKGAGSCAPRRGPMAAEGVGPSADAAGESPPGSPMNLSLAPDTLVPVALP